MTRDSNHDARPPGRGAVSARAGGARRALAAAAWLALAPATGRAAEVATAYPPMHRLTQAEYEGTLRFWRQRHPQWVTLEARGLSGRSLPVWLLRITDRTVPDTDKQVCLVTALHSGPERSGTTGALALIEWLLGDDPDAVLTRRRQVVLAMPVVNPLALFHTDRFRNDHKVDPYTGTGAAGKVWDVKSLTLLKPEEAPELAAVVSVFDQYQPDVHLDLHGTGLQEYAPDQLGARRMYHGQIMTEITGSAYSNYALRPWDWRVTEAMIAAGREAGFPSDRFEADAQRVFGGPEFAPLAKKTWSGSALFYSAHYGYAKYHTMTATLEVAWEQSAVARARGLLRIGNGIWLDERTEGYPVNRVKSFVGHFVTAYGATAAERRRSRVELWNRQADFAVGFLYPQTVGRASFVCAVTADAKRALAPADLPGLRRNLREQFGHAAGALERFLEAGPEIKLGLDTPAPALLLAKDNDAGSLQHGIGFRLRLPAVEVRGLQVELNGEGLAPSPTDGYESWPADGFTQVQIHVPPDRARRTGLFFVTCRYEPVQQHRTGWMPPPEVQREQGTAEADATPPTWSEVPYGPHFRQTLDFWQASSAEPTPLVFYVHGGGWAADDKSEIHRHLDVRALLKAGISVAAVNYRFLVDAHAAGVSPPVEWPLGDARRALQFVRAKAPEWKVDPARIAGSGVSAGGCAVLWLALHDDMADPQGADPIARASTRLAAVAAKSPVVSLDPQQLREWIPNSVFGAHAFGYAGSSRAESFAPFLAAREAHLPQIRRFSPIEFASRDDPPVFLEFPNQDKPPVPGEPQTDPTHSAVSGLMLARALQPLGVKVELRYRGDGRTGHANLQEALVDFLRPGPASP
ncbi:MAG: alpha/beta hydrolase fold domain-containing protein [Verrucomicrobia bacterium]|nr:alpha/beta hydrolase fold domain-containing protein [Verrucomicrobiota bacterium]